jgi:caffeoyl-CoA O-methyltransferase
MTNPARPVTPLGILAAKLEHIVQQAQSTSLSAPLKQAIEEAYHLASGLDPYLDRCTTPESAALAALAQKTQQEDWSRRFSDGETVRQLEQEMLSGHLEGQVLKMLIHMTKAKHVLEVGMFTGYSALAMAEALPEDGTLIACEVDPYVAEFAQQCFQSSPHGNKIKVAIGPALETMQQLADARETFDLVFVDADKKEYVDYFKLLLDSSLLTPNGFIVVDNTLFQGQPYLSNTHRTANGEAIAHFNQLVTADPRVEQVLLPVRDGVTIIRRI